MATKLQIYNEALRHVGDLRLATLTDDVEARYSLDDAWSRAIEKSFTQGLWNFATRTEQLTALGIDGVTTTYSQSGTTITVTRTAHGLVAGNNVYLTIGSGSAASGLYVVATAAANTFTVVAATSATTSGSVKITVTIPGNNYAFQKPNGWARTIQISTSSLFSNQVNYRDEGGLIHTNVTPVYMRYISDILSDDAYVTTWPEIFARVSAVNLAIEVCERLSQSQSKRDELEKIASVTIGTAKTIDAMDQGPIRLKNSKWLASMRNNNGGTVTPAQIDVQSIGDVG